MDDVSFESSRITLYIKNKHSVALSRRDHRRTSAFITGASAALTSPSAESTVQITSAAVISSPSAESTVQSSSQQQHNTTTSTPSPKAGIQKFTVITVPGMEKKWAEQRHRMITIIKVRLLGSGESAHADNRGPSRGQSPICPGTGTLPRPRPRFVRNRGLSPVPVPDLPGTGTLPRPRFPSGGPRPAVVIGPRRFFGSHSGHGAPWLG